MRAIPTRIPDVNILPEEYRWRLLTRLLGGALLVLIAGSVLAYFSFNNLTGIREEQSPLRTEHRRLLAAADELSPQFQQAKSLLQEITKLKEDLQKNRNARQTVLSQQREWQALLPPIFVSLPSDIELQSLTQSGTLIGITGVSQGGYPSIAQYYHQLQAISGVERVTIDRTEVKQEKEGRSYHVFELTLQLRED